jgi:hypothetical protein
VPHSRSRKNLVAALFALLALPFQPTLADTPAATGAAANGGILFIPHVPYSDQAEASDAIKQECALGEAVVTSIQKYAGELSVPLVSDVDAGAGARPEKPTRELTAQITRATPGVFAFFNVFSKPATLVIDFKVTDGDKVLLEKSRTCATKHAGSLGVDGRACAKLQKCANEQGAYINKWMKKNLD